MRQGRFPEAERYFEEVSRHAPKSPEGPLMEGLVGWWRLQVQPEDSGLRRAMEETLTEAARRAEILKESTIPSDRERGLVLGGIANLMQAQSQAAEKSFLKAGSLARKGHRDLDRALAIRPDSPEALFAMGTYNYYADHVSLLVKGLRFILLIPGGDTARGIQQLERAAEGGALFEAEALMMLGHIFSGHFEEDYRRALGYADRAGEQVPSSPLLTLARAELLFKLGRLREAASAASRAEALVLEGSGYPPVIGARASYRVAASTLELRDPLTALEQLRDGIERWNPSMGSDRGRWGRLLAEASREAGSPEWAASMIARLKLPEQEAASLKKKAMARPDDEVAAGRARAVTALSSGRVDEAEAELTALVEDFPGDAGLNYHLGRLLQQQGRFQEARPYLRAAADGGAPANLAGWAMVRLGWDLERTGHRDQAVALYSQAAKLKRFTFQAGALDLVAHPAVSQPEG